MNSNLSNKIPEDLTNKSSVTNVHEKSFSSQDFYEAFLEIYEESVESMLSQCDIEYATTGHLKYKPKEILIPYRIKCIKVIYFEGMAEAYVLSFTKKIGLVSEVEISGDVLFDAIKLSHILRKHKILTRPYILTATRIIAEVTASVLDARPVPHMQIEKRAPAFYSDCFVYGNALLKRNEKLKYIPFTDISILASEVGPNDGKEEWYDVLRPLVEKYKASVFLLSFALSGMFCGCPDLRLTSAVVALTGHKRCGKTKTLELVGKCLGMDFATLQNFYASTNKVIDDLAPCNNFVHIRDEYKNYDDRIVNTNFVKDLYASQCKSVLKTSHHYRENEGLHVATSIVFSCERSVERLVGSECGAFCRVLDLNFPDGKGILADSRASKGVHCAKINAANPSDHLVYSFARLLHATDKGEIARNLNEHSCALYSSNTLKGDVDLKVATAARTLAAFDLLIASGLLSSSAQIFDIDEICAFIGIAENKEDVDTQIYKKQIEYLQHAVTVDDWFIDIENLYPIKSKHLGFRDVKNYYFLVTKLKTNHRCDLAGNSKSSKQFRKYLALNKVLIFNKHSKSASYLKKINGQINRVYQIDRKALLDIES